ncbi:MAG: hypothetical protein J7502_02975 [Flavisolibacter sp.]|nr:hypothetical protein [Flavisolibacter sp.]
MQQVAAQIILSPIVQQVVAKFGFCCSVQAALAQISFPTSLPGIAGQNSLFIVQIWKAMIITTTHRFSSVPGFQLT